MGWNLLNIFMRIFTINMQMLLLEKQQNSTSWEIKQGNEVGQVTEVFMGKSFGTSGHNSISSKNNYGKR